MPASRSSSRRLAAILLAVIALTLGSVGCATLRPEEKERLADPSMTFTAGGMVERHEEHVLENREGSYGAGNARGGGCGCN